MEIIEHCEKVELRTRRKVVIAGGGASGLMAGLRAAELGAEVIIFEKMDTPARKLLMTGNGRCNATTGHDVRTAVAAFGKNGRFLHSAFSKYYSHNLIALLESLGVPVKMETDKRYFPVSNRSRDVADALTKKIEEYGGVIETGCVVKNIEVCEGRVSGVTVVSSNEPENQEPHFVSVDCIILAMGGMSYPATGSTGDGYALAAAAGHTIVPTHAALVPLVLEGEIFKALSPLAFTNAKLKLLCDKKELAVQTGEIMFTHFGITGPVVLNMSRYMPAAGQGGNVRLVVNLNPDSDEEDMRDRLRGIFANAGKKSVAAAIDKMLPKRAVPVFLAMAGIPTGRKCLEATKKERDSLARLFVHIEFVVAGTRPIKDAMVTAGGVNVKEIDPRTMESKIVGGLFVCGELLDVDGPSGGFNLQAAFSTGYTAGEAAAKEYM